jgi:type I restriction enzyme, R subunit
VGAEKRLRMVAEDLVQHFEDRVQAMDGKAMVVCMSRRICVALYDQIVALRPDWHSDDDDAGGLVKIVMTGSASDPEEWQPHIGNKARRDLLAKRAKDPNDPLRLVIVRDMWLTGFDAPSMHTMYIDKPMRGHGLMQAIARVNRVFRDKPAGLIVDYIGIAQNLKEASASTARATSEQAGIDEAEAIAVLLEKYDVVRAMFHGFDYHTGSPAPRRSACHPGGGDRLDPRRQHEAPSARPQEAKKRAHRRYQDAVLALSARPSPSRPPATRPRVRDEVGFFQAVRAALVKAADTTGAQPPTATSPSADHRTGPSPDRDRRHPRRRRLETPNISILSDEFLAEVQADGEEEPRPRGPARSS